jgi:hypothetical protein
MAIRTLEDFGALLGGLAVGQSATLPHSVYSTLFPPGEPDDGARARAYTFAKSHGCRIENQPGAGKVVFIRAVTNPSS